MLHPQTPTLTHWVFPLSVFLHCLISSIYLAKTARVLSAHLSQEEIPNSICEITTWVLCFSTNDMVHDLLKGADLGTEGQQAGEQCLKKKLPDFGSSWTIILLGNSWDTSCPKRFFFIEPCTSLSDIWDKHRVLPQTRYQIQFALQDYEKQSRSIGCYCTCVILH